MFCACSMHSDWYLTLRLNARTVRRRSGNEDDPRRVLVERQTSDTAASQTYDWHSTNGTGGSMSDIFGYTTRSSAATYRQHIRFLHGK